MSRPVDDNVEFSSRDIVLMDWVGDEHATYDELKTTHRYMLEVGRKSFVDFGSDIGTFYHKYDPLGRTRQVFLR
jgi:alpha-glucosidase (family GH31 glycosyl hydrolase)